MCGAHRGQDRVFKWREVAALAELEFLLEITGKIVVPRELDRWRKRSVSLHEYFAGGFSAPRASCYLCEKLKSAFSRAKIRQMQRQIGIDDSDQGHIRKMETLRDHLCTDEDVDFARTKVSQCFAIRFLTRHGVCIHAAHHSFGKNLRHG